MKRARLFPLAALVFALAGPALAGWSSLGTMPPPKRDGNTLLFQNEQGTLTLSVVAPDIVRVRFSPTQGLGRDHSYSVVGTQLGTATASFDVTPERSTIATSALRVTASHSPFRIAFASAAGESLDEDDPERGIAYAGKAVKVWKRLRDDEHVYGLGEKNGRLDKRGDQLGGANYVMWNTDAYGYGDDTDPLYASVPFFMVLRGGRTHGILLDNTFRTAFDIGHEHRELLSFGAESGELNYYFVYGPSPKQVLERLTALTGRMPLPPRWALGYHQCRYSYYPESKVRFIADNFRVRGIPADVIWLDIHYLDSYNPLTWDKERFPDPRKMLTELRAQGFRVVTIVDPHPKKERGSVPYETGLAGGHFVKNPDGSVFEGPVWPSRGEHNPGPSVFPDYSKAAARDWWGGLYASLLDAGVAGIWNDMNEPAVFLEPAHTMPLDLRHDNEGQPTDHREIHNVYGQLMSRSTFEGLSKLRPNQRPFVLTRSSFAGGQRYAALWPGDNTSDWSQLRATIPILTGLGLSGMAFVGSDIGGFAEAPSPELYTRWLQLGVFYPFMRTHTAFGTPDQEPWSYGTSNEARNRRAIELRYELLPQVYNVMQEASETGIPAFRPLMLEYPDDPNTYNLGDEVLFGRDLLVAPVLREAATARELYLPAGDWYDFWNGRLHRGGTRISVPVTLDSIPVFVKGGSFVFRQPVVQHTGEMNGQPLKVFVYPGSSSEARLYEDDGQSLDYRKGAYLKRRFEQRRSGSSCAISVSAAEGTYRPSARSLELWVRFDGQPRSASLGSEALPRVPAEKLGAEARGWTTTDDGFVVVKLRDRWDAFRVTLEP